MKLFTSLTQPKCLLLLAALSCLSCLPGDAAPGLTTATAHSWRGEIIVDSSFSQSASLLICSGRVTITLKESDGPRAVTSGVAGVTITFTRLTGSGGAPPPAQTDSNGNWNKYGFEPFVASDRGKIPVRYRATPSKSGLAFDPPFIEFSGQRTDLNFAARIDSFTASGKVTTVNGSAVSGVSIRVTAQGGTLTNQTVTNSQGQWSLIIQNASPSFRVAPGLADFSFSPAFRDFSKTNASQLNFSLPSFFNIDGTIKGDIDPRASGLSGAQISFERISGSCITPLATTSDVSGNFRQTGFVTGCSYRVKAANRGRVCATFDVAGERHLGRINCL